VKIRNAALVLTCLSLFYASSLHAQQTGQLDASMIPEIGVSSPDSIPTPITVAAAADPAGPAAPQAGAVQGATGGDDQWHLSVSPYLWLPGAHGTLGAFNREAGFKVSPSDLLSHFRLGVLGAVEVRRNRLLTTLDLMYLRLGANNAIPSPPAVQAVSANFTANIFILTPKIGIRLIDQKSIKADFLAGIRYWYFGENVSFSPSVLGLNFSRSQNFVDPLVGGRIEAALTPKVVFTVAGDVGGWGAASQLEYQVVGLLGYKLKPNMTLQGGYRYLYLDYTKSGPANPVLNVAMSGVVLGVTMNLK
jgi:hypothetical protein